jgi:GNAT superfamily N-acetyltransferase
MARIREITDKDIPEGARIMVQSEPWRSRGANEESLRRLLEASLGRGDTFVAEEESLPAGLACFIPEPVIAEGGCVRFIVVREDKRRRGIGRQLMGFVERKVFSRSASVFVSIPAGSEAARRFFERLGYEKVGEVPASAGEPPTEWILRKAWKARAQYQAKRPAV